MSTFDPVYDLPIVNAVPDAQFQASLEAIAPNITTIAEQQRMPSESWMDAVLRMLPALTATWQQKQLLEVQIERAKQGLPPLSANQIATGVNVGIAPDTQKLLMWGMAGLVLVIALPQVMRAFNRR